jgi:hypothetical protein
MTSGIVLVFGLTYVGMALCIQTKPIGWGPLGVNNGGSHVLGPGSLSSIA